MNRCESETEGQAQTTSAPLALHLARCQKRSEHSQYRRGSAGKAAARTMTHLVLEAFFALLYNTLSTSVLYNIDMQLVHTVSLHRNVSWRQSRVRDS